MKEFSNVCSRLILIYLPQLSSLEAERAQVGPSLNVAIKSTRYLIVKHCKDLN